MKWRKLDRNFLKYLLWITMAILLIVYIRPIIGAIRVLFRVVQPLLTGCLIAYILNIILVNLERIWFPRSEKRLVKKTRRGVCILLSFALVLTAIVVLLSVILPELWKAFLTATSGLPGLFERLREWILVNADEFPSVQNLVREMDIDWSAIMQKVSGMLTEGLNNVVNTAFGTVISIVGFVFNVIVSVIFALYLLANKEKLGRQIRRVARAMCSPRLIRVAGKVLEVTNESFTSFFVGQFVEAIILGTLCFIGMSILRFPYASMIGTLVGATALIPILGAYIGAILGALLICLVSPLKALEFILFIIILQQLEGNLIYPRVVGTSIGLPGIWVFAAVMVGSSLAGIGGVLLGVPVTATVYKLVRLLTEQKEAEKERLLMQAAAREAGEPETASEVSERNQIEEEQTGVRKDS